MCDHQYQIWGFSMDSTIIASLIGVVGGLTGAFIGSYFTKSSALNAVESSNKNAVAIMKDQEFIVASAKLRASFAPAQAKLRLPREIGNIEARKFFDDAFLVHASAVEEFRPFASNAVVYQEAWEDYRKALYEDDALGDADLRWNSGMVVYEDGKETLDFLNLLNQKIRDILHFASPK